MTRRLSYLEGGAGPAGQACVGGSTTPRCCSSWPRARTTSRPGKRPTRELAALRTEIDQLEIRTLLNGEYDSREALISINAQAGGADAADFAENLLRMYLRWAERHGYPTEVYDTSYAEEAGIKSTTFAIKAPYAYGTLRGEHGTHRMVRISKYDNQGRRQTSFAGVDVIPVVEQTDHIDIPEDEIRVDVYRSSGPGGQGVNTTDSAVRHHPPAHRDRGLLPERAQPDPEQGAPRWPCSRPSCWSASGEEQASQDARRCAATAAAAGAPRSATTCCYPYQNVKDVRTGLETGNTGGRAGRRDRRLHRGRDPLAAHQERRRLIRALRPRQRRLSGPGAGPAVSSSSASMAAMISGGLSAG